MRSDAFRPLLAGFAVTTFFANPFAALAANFPTRSVRVVVGFSAGGGADLMARLIADKLSNEWNQPVVVLDKPGATGAIAADYVAHALPDGYTIGLVTSSHISPPDNVKLDYDPIKSFAPVSLLASQPDILVVNGNLPVQTTKDLIGYAKSHSGRLAAGSGSPGLPAYAEMNRFERLADIRVVNVPFNGAAPAITALLGGEVQIMFGGIAALKENLKAGRIRALAVADGERSALLPDVPTLKESAGLPGFEHGATWYGVVAPAGTPESIVETLRSSLVKAIQSPGVGPKLTRSGFTIIGGTPEQFAAFLNDALAAQKEPVGASPKE